MIDFNQYIGVMFVLFPYVHKRRVRHPFCYNGSVFARLAEGAWFESREGLSFSPFHWYFIKLLSPSHES
jgi:hypothetical protein